jgi:SAM-dependent methyltransferase
MKTKSNRSIIHRVFRRLLTPSVQVAHADDRLAGLAARDRWFHLHFVVAPEVIVDHLSKVIPLKSSVVLDFGCGEGIMTKGVARFAREVHGIDLVPSFWQLEERFQRMFGPGNEFPPVALKTIAPDQCLPFEEASFDAVYAWSVFEHVADVPTALAEIHRVLRPGGVFFLQIEPLYHSPHGAHLWNILDEPWIHLKLRREELVDRVRQAPMHGSADDSRMDLSHGISREEYRNSVIDFCLPTLNQITLRELTSHAQDAGFQILLCESMRDCRYEVPNELLRLHAHEDLVTAEVRMLMVR